MSNGSGRRLAIVSVVATLVLATPGAAWAHNQLKFADPADTAALAAAPRQITLTFSERLDPRFTTVAVTDAAGTAMTGGPVQVSETTAVQPLLPTLGAGSFTVAYRVVSVDGHPVAGSLRFTVTLVEDPAQFDAVPSATPSAAEGVPAAAATPVARAGGGSDGAAPVLWAAAVVAVLVGLGAVIVRRRRSAGTE